MCHVSLPTCDCYRSCVEMQARCPFTGNVNTLAPICNATFPCQEACASSCPARALPSPKAEPMPNNNLHTSTPLHLLSYQRTCANESRYRCSAVRMRAVPCSTRKVRPGCLCRQAHAIAPSTTSSPHGLLPVSLHSQRASNASTND